MRGTLPRMGWVVAVALSSMIGAATRSCVPAARAAPLPVVDGLGCVAITVSDADRSLQFYGSVLGFE
jgi:hypothetical protein